MHVPAHAAGNHDTDPARRFVPRTGARFPAAAAAAAAFPTVAHLGTAVCVLVTRMTCTQPHIGAVFPRYLLQT